MMARVTTDEKIVKFVFNELKDVIGDETSPSVDEVDWAYHFEHDLFVEIADGEDLCGLVCFYHGATPEEWKIHMNILKQHRGPKAVWAYNAAVAILKSKYDVRRLEATIPHKYPNVWSFAEKRGFSLKQNDGADRVYELEFAN